MKKETPPLRILVIGCGGGGCNSISRLHTMGIRQAETVAINTDKRHLSTIEADKRLLISSGKTKGLGAGGDPSIGRECAHNAIEPLTRLLQRIDLVFITAGMGGGTGTGAAPVVAELAKRHGALVISIVTTPFDFEGRRKEVAMRGLDRLDDFSDTLLILDNNRLLDMVPDLPVEQALRVMDTLISEIITGLIEAISEPSLINLDFADLRTILSHGGISSLLYGENADPESVVQDALANPLMEMDIEGATGALIHITGGNNLTLRRVNRIMNNMTRYFDAGANIICGTRIDDRYEGQIRVMAVITGIAELVNPSRAMEVDDELERSLVRYNR